MGIEMASQATREGLQEIIQFPGVLLLLYIAPIVNFCALAGFGPAQSPFYHPRIAADLDSRYGERAFETFLVRIKPCLLFGIASLSYGIVKLAQPYMAYLYPAPFISCGIAFIAAHFIWLHRKAIGVCPTPASGSPPRPTITEQPLKPVSRLYWWCLAGVFVQPAICLVGMGITPFGFFFSHCFLSMIFFMFWPTNSMRASYPFWYIAVVVWLAGTGMALYMNALVRP
jgi:hypothetical protein